MRVRLQFYSFARQSAVVRSFADLATNLGGLKLLHDAGYSIVQQVGEWSATDCQQLLESIAVTMEPERDIRVIEIVERAMTDLGV